MRGRVRSEPEDYAPGEGPVRVPSGAPVRDHAAVALRERDLLWRILAATVALLLTLGGWVGTRELGRIAEATTMTAASIGRLEDRMGRVSLDQAALTARLDRVEEIARHADQLAEGCRR